MGKSTDACSYLPRNITLMYHRINTPETDPWGICVSISNFEKQIQFLKNNYNIISSGDLIRQLTTRNISDNSICLTFDDGYADNYTNAKPILEKYECPATFFIATAFTGQPRPFWWEELEIILLHSMILPGRLSLLINGKNHLYTFNEAELTRQQLLQHANWKWYVQPPTDRCAMFLSIWKKLRPLLNDEIEKQMARIRKWAAVNHNENVLRLPMNEEQLGKLSKNRLFTIAMHTHTHPDLRGKDRDLQVNEILSCRKLLTDKYSIECNCLAYPFGSYNTDTLAVVKKLGIKACFTTAPAVIDNFSNTAILGRYQVFNADIDGLKHQLTS